MSEQEHPRALLAPWSPMMVSLIALFLPAGGAVLTVLNLQRLKEIDTATARLLAGVAVAVFIVGLASLFAGARRGASGGPQIDSTAATLLSFGVAVASYGVQRLPFRHWRVANTSSRTSSWLSGIGIAAVYQVVVVALAVPLVLIATAMGAGPLAS